MLYKIKFAVTVTLLFVFVLIGISSCSKKDRTPSQTSETLAPNNEREILYSKRGIIEEKLKTVLISLPSSSVLLIKDTISAEWVNYFRKLITEGTSATKMSSATLLNYTYRINSILNAIDAANNVTTIAREDSGPSSNPCNFCPQAAGLPPNAPCTFTCSAYRLCCLSNAGALRYNPATRQCETDDYPCWDCAECNLEQIACYAACILTTPPKRPLRNFISPVTGLQIKSRNN